MGFGEPYSMHADANGIGWNPDWVETSPNVFVFVGDENGPANNYLRYSDGTWAPNEDFASSFASVVIETNINLVMTEKLLFGFAETLVRDDSVIPALENTMRLEIDRCPLFAGNRVASFVLFSIQISTAA